MKLAQPLFQLVGDVIEYMGEPVARIQPIVPENRFYPELKDQLENTNDDNGEYL